ncbi:predicted protein [Sclerotinia sclerotiorum 1980 UF-70]|uniref:Uncharacterized protein n=2 Tax=Sclerotinia sclerotiorum (strain ATCC 18683 / 1980 / Ss-1) TaxID=665079 RepID=A7F165_SCLS1|nr:predicted protein [Sclerotinia sclerotiorum 1980 UF-70]APA11145.1 hypothetical protein sscle_07g059150 [Sclerotinia sclerotiorum 1980 UF-70]EDN95457.1 predicted protein [Sclerotinia sclerotiorum 1980 UF-70]
MPFNGKPNGRFELPALTSFDFNLTDGTDIPPPLPDSPIEEEAIKSTTASAHASAASTPVSVPQNTDPVRSTTSTPPTSASASANGHSDFAPLTATKSHGFSNLTTTKSHGYFPPNISSPRNHAPPVRARAPSDVAVSNTPTRPEKESSIRKFLSRKSFNSNYTSGNAKSHEDLSKMVRPESPSSLASSKPSFVKRKSGSWFRSFGSSSKRNSVVYVDKPVVYTPTLQRTPEIQKENTKPVYTKPSYTKPGPPPPKLPELNQLKAKIADDDRGSLGGDEMFRNIS